MRKEIEESMKLGEKKISEFDNEQKKAEELIASLNKESKEKTSSRITEFAIALAYRKYRDENVNDDDDQQAIYDDKLKEIIDIRKKLTKLRNKIFSNDKIRSEIETLETQLINREDELHTIIYTCNDCIIKDRRDDVYKELDGDPNNERYTSKIRNKKAFGSSLGLRSKLKVYNIGVKNIYDFNDAFHKFRRGINNMSQLEGEEAKLYETAIPFLYEDKIRIALIENNMEDLKMIVAFLDKKILNGDIGDDIGSEYIKEQLYNSDSNLRKQYEIARKKVGQIKEKEYKKIEQQYNNEIDFGFLTATQNAKKLLEERKTYGLQDRFVFDKSDWAKSSDPDKVNINVDNLNQIVDKILTESRIKIGNSKNKIYDKNHIELPAVLQGTNMWFFMKQSSREQEKELQNLRKTKEDLFKAAFNVVKIVEYYRNSGYTDKLKQALAEENVIWARKNISLYNLLKNEHTRIINQLKEYGVRKGMGGDGGKVATFLNKYTATIRKKTNVVAGTQRLFSAEKSKNIIYDRQTLPGHRPIRSDDIKIMMVK